MIETGRATKAMTLSIGQLAGLRLVRSFHVNMRRTLNRRDALDASRTRIVLGKEARLARRFLRRGKVIGTCGGHHFEVIHVVVQLKEVVVRNLPRFGTGASVKFGGSLRKSTDFGDELRD